MKKKIHPSTPPISDHLSLLPATILTLTVALSPEDRQVLAYLISCSANSNSFSSQQNKTKAKAKFIDHAPQFECSCFRCYMSYWVRWNNSPNREIIHDIIDAYEDGLVKKKGGGGNSGSNGLKSKKGKRRGNYNSNPGESEEKGKLKEAKQAELSFQGEEGGSLDKESSVKKIVSFLGGRIWGVWGIWNEIQMILFYVKK